MATLKPRSRSNNGFHNPYAFSAQNSKRRTSTVSKRTKKKISLSAATVSSSGSEANAKLSEDSPKSSCSQKPISSSGSSGFEANSEKACRGKPKKKVTSKLKKKSKLQLKNIANPEACSSTAIGSRDDGCIDVSDSIVSIFNETLRWSNICSDSEEEVERLRIYKENRRKRYVEAMHVKVVQKMSECKQK